MPEDEFLSEAEKKRRRDEQLKRMAERQTEVSAAEYGTEQVPPAKGEAGGYVTRETVKRTEKAEKEGPRFSLGQVKAQQEKAGGTPMPTQANWQDRYPNASGFADAVRLWREAQPKSAQRTAIQKAKDANK